MKLFFFFFFFSSLISLSCSKEPKDYQNEVNQIIDKATHQNHFAWNSLAEVTDTFGHRILGSPELKSVCDWLESLLKANKFENVKQELVSDVPYWKRGEESLELLKPRHQSLRVLGLGLSMEGHIEGHVIVVKSKSELDELGEKVKGKIVVYNYEWKDYSSAVAYRVNGGAWASKYGAIGALIRSAAPYGIYTTHTGMQNVDYTPKIMTACITIEDSNMLSRMQERGDEIYVKLKMHSKLTNSNSTNVIGEFIGTEKKHEVIILGGHIDSWDVGLGAMDDGCGFITCLNAVKTLIDLGLRPKRTIRFIAFAGEEFGGYGGRQYALDYKDQLPNHIFALESDMGCFKPYGFGFSGKSERAQTLIKEIISLQKKIDVTQYFNGGGGLDIDPICQSGCPCGSPKTHNDDYFFYHHTEGDRMDVLDANELDLNVASIASLIYVLADMDETLPRE